MKKRDLKPKSLIVMSLILVSGYANAISVFTDRTSFETAIGTLSIEDFESSPVIGTPSSGAQASATFSLFTVSSTPNAVKVLDAPFLGVDNTTPGGSQYLYLDTDVGLQGSVSTFNFTAPLLAVGFDYSQLNEPGTSPSITIGGDVISIPLNPLPFDDFNPLFIGVIPDTSFQTFTIDSGIDSGFGIDQLTTSVVPIPAGLWLFGSGLIGLIGVARRKRS